MPLQVILVALAVLATAGIVAVIGAHASARRVRFAGRLATLACALGAAGAVPALTGGTTWDLHLTGFMSCESMRLELDALGAFFLLPLFIIGGAGIHAQSGYWRQAELKTYGPLCTFFWAGAVGGMALLILARHAVFFLLGWEFMALSSFFLIRTETAQAEARWAAWVYLVTTHAGTLCLFAMFALLRGATGTFDFVALDEAQVGLGRLTAIFALALAGFGLKAGLMPLHFWLPPAHASAPCHVSALLSGIMIKMGIYGLVRIMGLLPEPPLAWGGVLLAAGGVSGVLGVAFAIGQHDLKRLLAYHSVENIGIIVMGIGLAMAGRSLGRPELVLLGLSGGLLHVWNHGLFKSLLFLGAGAVVHATHTREIDRLGGLAPRMPRTAGLFLLGSAAICGLPPLNGFVSELFLYMGLFRTVGTGTDTVWTGAAAGVPVLALIGTLALACFVKVYGVAFLGEPRSQAARQAHEAPRTMLVSMAVLGLLCVAIGLLPVTLVPMLEGLARPWCAGADATMPTTMVTALAWTGGLGCALIATAGAGYAVMRAICRKAGTRAGTWDCGFIRPTARIQYTASSFAQMLLHGLRWFLRPDYHRPVLRRPFADKAHFESHVPDAVLDRQLLPAARLFRQGMARLRKLQQGQAQHYIVCILITLVAVMVWTMPVGNFFARLFAR